MSIPAKTAQEAIQFTYFGYLAAVKSQNGAAMSLGRTSTFIDVFVERDIANGLITEQQAQEMVDHFIMKLRMVVSYVHLNMIHCSLVTQFGQLKRWLVWGLMVVL